MKIGAGAHALSGVERRRAALSGGKPRERRATRRREWRRRSGQAVARRWKKVVLSCGHTLIVVTGAAVDAAGGWR